MTLDQIRDWNLHTRPTKQSDSRAKGFSDISVELDAIPPDQLRAMVRDAIEDHLPPHEYCVLMAAEKSERAKLFMHFVGNGAVVMDNVRRLRHVNFTRINSAALAALPAILGRLLPGGRIHGHEYVVRNPTRADRHRSGSTCGLAAGLTSPRATVAAIR